MMVEMGACRLYLTDPSVACSGIFAFLSSFWILTVSERSLASSGSMN